MLSKSISTQFVYSFAQIWRNAHQWISAVNGCRQNESPNITIIHTTPIHQLMSCEVKSCMFGRNRIIINRRFWPKCESIIVKTGQRRVDPLAAIFIRQNQSGNGQQAEQEYQRQSRDINNTRQGSRSQAQVQNSKVGQSGVKQR